MTETQCCFGSSFFLLQGLKSGVAPLGRVGGLVLRQVLRNLHRGMEPERHHTWSISLRNRASAIWWLRGRQAGGCLACTCVPGSQEPNTAKLHRLPCSPRRLPFTSLGTGCQTFARDTLARLAGRKMATFYFQRLSSFGGSGGMVQRFLSLSCVFGLEKCVSLNSLPPV